MGLLDRLLGRTAVQNAASNGTVLDVVQPARLNLGEPYESFDGLFYGSSGIAIADPGVPLSLLRRGDVEQVWATQPDVRKVVSFIARNVATIPLHLYERVSDTDRQRVHGTVLNDALGSPQRGVPPVRFWESVLTDGLLYDRWGVLKVPTPNGGLDLVQVPSWRLRLHTDILRRVVAADMWVGDGPSAEGDRDGYRPLDLDSLIFDHGYAPRSAGLSPVDTLRETLAEREAALEQRKDFFINKARVGTYIWRPAEAPEWGEQNRNRFVAGFRAAFGRGGSNPGGSPLFEDGMELRSVPTYTSHETFDLEGRKLTAEEVAGFFHIAPELVGARQGNYSNVREYRQMLYRDSLGPYIDAWAGALNAQLVPEFSGARNLYIEPHVDAKLRGSFEEQADVIQKATGGPYMTMNEARALQNRAPIEGGDLVARPLNLRYGSSTVTPSDTSEPGTSSGVAGTKGRTASVKARPEQSVVDQAVEVLSAFFDRQGRTVASAAGAGGDLWDADRWNRELADELMAVNVLVATTSGRKALESLGFDADRWDEDRTLAWLRANADGVAESANEATRQQVEDAVADAEDRGGAVAALFAGTVAARATSLGESQVSAVAGFGTSEAVNQLGIEAQKTWRVRSTNPRPSHAALNGVTVGMGEAFANGARWPGDSLATPDERAGCTCDIEVSVR